MVSEQELKLWSGEDYATQRDIVRSFILFDDFVDDIDSMITALDAFRKKHKGCSFTMNNNYSAFIARGIETTEEVAERIKQTIACLEEYKKIVADIRLGVYEESK